jgi:pimeloyl-ACP methyl ester carboxylesterase
MYYIKDKGDKASGVMGILAEIDRKIRFITQDIKECLIIAHSLGSVIAFDYLFGFRKYRFPEDVLVQAYISMGSPIPIFTSSMGHVDSELSLPANIKHWYNIYEQEDAIARRCAPFFKNIPVKDLQVNTGLLPLSAHARYWKNKQTAEAIAKILILLGD